MLNAARALDSWLIGPHANGSPEDVRRARLLQWFCLLIVSQCMFWSPVVGWAYDLPVLSIVCAVGAVVFGTLLHAIHRGLSLRTGAAILVSTCVGMLALAGPLSIGVTATMTPWIAIIILLAAYLLGARWGAYAATALTVLLVSEFALEEAGWVVPVDPRFVPFAEQLIGPTILSLWVTALLTMVYATTLERELQERVRFERDLRHAQRLEAMGRVVAGLAHEINNPLAFVLANVQLVREQQPANRTTEVVRALDDAAEGVERVRRLVADLRVFSRHVEEPLAWIRVDEVVAFALKLAGNLVRQAAQIEVSIPPGLEVLAGRSQLGQVVLNLVTNAAQALGEGSADQHRIAIRATLEADGVRIDVNDTGRGMDANTLEHMFDPFFTTKGAGGGTGLGLPISREIVQKLGGSLVGTSEPGAGTRFSIRLPSGRVSEEPPAPPVEGLEPSPVAEEAPAVQAARGRILVIDDEPALCSAIRRILKDLDVETETDARAALERCKSERFDLVLCDLTMPNMDGEQFLRAYLELRPEAEGRVVFVTGGAISADKAAFLRRHQSLQKPVGIQEIRQLVHEKLSDPNAGPPVGPRP